MYVILFGFIFFASCANTSQKNNTVLTDAKIWLLPFNKLNSANPIMQPGNKTFFCPVQNKQVKWEAKNVYNPAVTVLRDTLFMLYRAQDSSGCSRIGLAKSTDGIHFIRNDSPVLFPDNDAYKKYEWPGGCEDPRLTQDSAGTYYITYTAYDGKLARLMIATSTDLYHWKKFGPAFTDKQYENMWSKSGSIISSYDNNKIVAAKINGLYTMYWGDKYIWIATSDDLIHWAPQYQAPNKNFDSVYSGYKISSLKIAIPTRKNKFDCDLVESGPPAMLTSNGILLIYNSRNIPSIGDTSLPQGTYTVAQVLLDKNDPAKIIDRMGNYFLKPQQPYEFSGEVNNVCFAEGLAFYKNKWWLYYGTADSKIAVAVKQ
ncbi:MAG: hypothetical protein JO072_05535 [Parafilimonas sp.]|nr:hypothetical protein [Parafilimonas sp.]